MDIEKRILELEHIFDMFEKYGFELFSNTRLSEKVGVVGKFKEVENLRKFIRNTTFNGKYRDSKPWILISEKENLDYYERILDGEVLGNPAFSARGVFFGNSRNLSADALTKILGNAFIGMWVSIGANSAVQPFTTVGGNCSIGNYCNIGEFVDIENTPVEQKKTTIGDNVKIGAGAIVGYGSQIGNNVVIKKQVIIPPKAIIDPGVIIDKDFVFNHFIS